MWLENLVRTNKKKVDLLRTNGKRAWLCIERSGSQLPPNHDVVYYGNLLYFLSASLHQEEYISKAIFQGKMIQFVTAALLQGSVLYIYKISKWKCNLFCRIWQIGLKWKFWSSNLQPQPHVVLKDLKIPCLPFAEGIPSLINLLTSDSPDVREGATLALANITTANSTNCG